MKAFQMNYLFTAPIAGILALGLMGCQGQNPFKRQSDPVTEYRPMLEEAKPKVEGEENKKPVTPDNTLAYCNAPFRVFVENDAGVSLLKFFENRKTSYNVTVISDFKQNDFTIKASGHPKGVEFKQVSKKDNVANYSLSWTPGNLGQEETEDNLIYLTYSSEFNKQTCPGRISKIGLNLSVRPGDNQMFVTVSGTPQKAIEFGKDGNFSFDVTIEDPTSNKNAPPELDPQAVFSDSLKNSEIGTLDGSSAADCDVESLKQVDSKKWSYKCKFTSATLPPQTPGTTATFAFGFSAQSADGKTTVLSNAARVQVQFPKIAPTTTPTQGGNQ